MHPQVIQDEPGLCPICGMRLVPVRSAAAGAGHEGMETAAGVSGAGIRVDPGFLQNFGVRTAMVERGAIPIEIRTVGVLSHDEQNLVAVNAKFDGWIEKAYVNNIGEHVDRGDALFEIYSPQLVTTQKEYLAARKYFERMRESGYPEAVASARSLLEAARERLRYWDISDDQIDALDRSGETQRTLRIVSPASGRLIEKVTNSLEGTKVMPGMSILKLADHSRLWAEVKLYEQQLRYAREGQTARVEAEAFPGGIWSGRVVRFGPHLDASTRTLTAYVEIANTDRRLRPQMFVDVTIRAPGVAGAVKVPREAVLHSGERSVVIVQKSRGIFEPREVELGPAGGEQQEVRRGLEPGEVVVTSSQFLIDSESNLKAAIGQMLTGHEGAEGERPPPTPPGHVHD
jgi:RND family efflux transporter MFP subunit